MGFDTNVQRLCLAKEKKFGFWGIVMKIILASYKVSITHKKNAPESIESILANYNVINEMLTS